MIEEEKEATTCIPDWRNWEAAIYPTRPVFRNIELGGPDFWMYKVQLQEAFVKNFNSMMMNHKDIISEFLCILIKLK